MSRKKKNSKKLNTGLSLIEIEPLTETQERVFECFESYFDDVNLVLSGFAGTGKTFIAMYLSFKQILDKNAPQEKIVLFRSAVPTRDVGFLKGSLTEKMSVYESPYKNIVNQIFACGSAYESMKGRGKIEFLSTSFNRGITIDNAIIIVDEAQNLTDHEIMTIITRIGENSRIIFCGDYRQGDLNPRRETSGFGLMIKIAKIMEDDFEVIEFDIDDIVRNDMIKRYLKVRNHLQLD